VSASRPLKLAYGVGELAKGVEDAATNLFILFFFSQVLGLSSWVVGAVMATSLVIDAMADPLMGSWSDGFRHRWGRRHPFLLAAALPVGVTFALLFSPPGFSTAGLTAWMAILLLVHRLALTVFFVPHLALGAELSDDYDERTGIAAVRVFFTYLGAAVMVGAGRAVFFRPTAGFPDGQLDAAAYPRMGLVFGLFMTAVVLLSTFGTWRRIPLLPRGPERSPPLSLARFFAEQREVFSNKPFAVLVGSLLLFFVARGTALALDIYVGTYFWRLGSDAVALPGIALLGILVGAPLSAVVASGVDKRHVFVRGMALYSVLSMAPPLLHVLGVFPTGRALRPALFLTLFASGVVGAGAFVASGSILADIADAHELCTGHRREGLFFGAFSFARKAATGAGTVLGGLFLSAVAFPKQAIPGTVDPRLVTALGLCAGPGTALFGIAGVWLASRYRADRGAHAATRAALAARSGASQG
jgi:Na+/melibiose symporter-like transporter